VKRVYIFNTFVNLEPVHKSEDWCNVRKSRSFNLSTGKTVWNLLEAIYLRL